MKLVNREEFLALPPGTVFCKYHGICNIGELAVKEETYATDYRYVDLLEVAGPHDESLNNWFVLDETREAPIEPSSLRDGLFDAEQVFAVLDEQDVRALVQELMQLYEDRT